MLMMETLCIYLSTHGSADYTSTRSALSLVAYERLDAAFEAFEHVPYQQQNVSCELS